jgi:hypothetical protein
MPFQTLLSLSGNHDTGYLSLVGCFLQLAVSISLADILYGWYLSYPFYLFPSLSSYDYQAL